MSPNDTGIVDYCEKVYMYLKFGKLVASCMDDYTLLHWQHDNFYFFILSFSAEMGNI
jgi:hypothetical protein